MAGGDLAVGGAGLGGAAMTDPVLCPACAKEPRKRGQLMCRRCWYLVPAPLRRAVNQTWSAFKATRAGSSSAATKISALNLYRANADEAVHVAFKALADR